MGKKRKEEIVVLDDDEGISDQMAGFLQFMQSQRLDLIHENGLHFLNPDVQQLGKVARQAWFGLSTEERARYHTSEMEQLQSLPTCSGRAGRKIDSIARQPAKYRRLRNVDPSVISFDYDQSDSSDGSSLGAVTRVWSDSSSCSPCSSIVALTKASGSKGSKDRSTRVGEVAGVGCQARPETADAAVQTNWTFPPNALLQLMQQRPPRKSAEGGDGAGGGDGQKSKPPSRIPGTPKGDGSSRGDGQKSKAPPRIPGTPKGDGPSRIPGTPKGGGGAATATAAEGSSSVAKRGGTNKQSSSSSCVAKDAAVKPQKKPSGNRST